MYHDNNYSSQTFPHIPAVLVFVILKQDFKTIVTIIKELYWLEKSRYLYLNVQFYSIYFTSLVQLTLALLIVADSKKIAYQSFLRTSQALLYLLTL